MEQKVFRNFSEQIDILRDRGLKVPDDDFTKKYLKEENYYNVINGYKNLFLLKKKTKDSDEVYKKETNFYEIKALYEFDFELKSIILKRILRVENIIKTNIAYNFSEKYGYKNYMKMENFDFKYRDADSIKNVMDLITGVQGIIAKQINKHEAIRHYMTEYGYVPLWVLVNILPLGTISKFYSLMKQKDKQMVSKTYKISDMDLSNILKNLTYCRNKCAHGEILYNFKSSTDLKENRIHEMLEIPKVDGKSIKGKSDLFSIIISLKLLLNEDDFCKMIEELRDEINILAKNLKVITIEEVLNEMGFVDNWIEIKRSK